MALFDDATSIADRVFAGRHLKLLVLSRAMARTYVPAESYGVVSITEPGQPPAALAESDNLRAVLRLQFHDAQQADVPGLEELNAAALPSIETPDIEKLLEFVDTHLGEIGLLICHCEAGVSRSAAVAAALSRMINGEDAFFFAHYYPNVYVYRTIMDYVRTIDFRVRQSG